MPPTVRRLRKAVADVALRRDRRADELADLLLAIDRDGDPRAAAAAGELLSAAPPHVWLLLDVAVRRPWGRPVYRSGATRPPRGGSSPVGTVLAALQADGYAREAAVARLAALDDELAVPALALRATDWVPQVRDHARSALERRLTEVSGQALVAAAAIAFALGERREGQWLAERVRAAFRDGPDAVLTAGLTAADPRTRRAAYRAALAAGRLDLPRLLRAARYDPDLVIKVRCAEAAASAASAAGQLDLVRPLLTGGAAAVRAEAVDALARGGDIAPAIAALTDRNAMVRAVAQAAVRRAGSDPLERYRRLAALPVPGPGAQVAAEAPIAPEPLPVPAHLAEPAPPLGAERDDPEPAAEPASDPVPAPAPGPGTVPAPGVLAGLGETGTAADAALVRPWLVHPSPRGRTEAVRALRRLGAADPDRLAAMLTDPSGAVTRQVAMALRPWASRLDPAYLRSLLAADNPEHVRAAAYRLLHARDTWTRLLTDLDLLTDASRTMRARARADIASWLLWEAATTYAMPQGRTADAFARRLAVAEHTLDAGRLRELRFHLGLGAQPTV